MFESCERLEKEAGDSTTSAGEASPCLAPDEACWMARAKFGVASMELRECFMHLFMLLKSFVCEI